MTAAGTRAQKRTSEPVKIIATNGLQSKGGGRYLCAPPGRPDLHSSPGDVESLPAARRLKITFLQDNLKSPGGPDHHFSLFGFRVQR